MVVMTPADPSATLEAIKERAKAAAAMDIDVLAAFNGVSVGGVIAASAVDVPSLVAALEAVLKLHQPGRIMILGSTCKRHEAHRHFSITRTEADDVRNCPDCTATVYNSCTGCGPGVNVDACVTRTAITRTLNGDTDG